MLKIVNHKHDPTRVVTEQREAVTLVSQCKPDAQVLGDLVLALDTLDDGEGQGEAMRALLKDAAEASWLRAELLAEIANGDRARHSRREAEHSPVELYDEIVRLRRELDVSKRETCEAQFVLDQSRAEVKRQAARGEALALKLSIADEALSTDGGRPRLRASEAGGGRGHL